MASTTTSANTTVPCLVTGSSGHLGTGLVRVLASRGHRVLGLDVMPGPTTDVVGSVSERAVVAAAVRAAVELARDAATLWIFHVATLHKPHVGTHTKAQFVEVNVTGTLHLLEEAADLRESGVHVSFVFTSTTSTFGDALRPTPAQPTTWTTEDTKPVPRNIYGVTKNAAEDLCHLFHRTRGLDVLVLKTSRFFLEVDDDPATRAQYSDANCKANELLNRRVDLEDVVSAHLLAAEQAQRLRFGRYIISTTSPFTSDDASVLRGSGGLAEVLRAKYPDCEALYEARGWHLPETGLDRVYVNDKARAELGWAPRITFGSMLDGLRAGREAPWSQLALDVGCMGYHKRPDGNGLAVEKGGAGIGERAGSAVGQPYPLTPL